MRVLFAENNLSSSLVARSVLERENHSVTIAANGAEAIINIQSKPFDVLLLDIVMPVMDGFQTVQYLQNLTSKPTHIFALSAYDTLDDIALYQASGFSGLIAKPLRPGDLTAALSVINGSGRTTLTGVAANAQDAESRPLLDAAIIRDGPGQADEITRRQIWQSYRVGLSMSLKDLSRALPGYLEQDTHAITAFLNALHSLRSSALTVGMNRAPYIAKELRDVPLGDVTDGVARLLHAVRDSLPVLETALLDIG